LAGRKEDPSFFAIIPATVRYDKSLNPYARLLYGELTALAKKEGYAWATNKYFANLYQVDRSSISHWIKQLQDKGYIRVELIYGQSRRFIEERRIFLTGLALEKPAEKGTTSPEAEGQMGNAEGEACPETAAAFDGMNNYTENCIVSEGGGDIRNQGVVTYVTRGGYKAPRRSLQAINTSSSSDPPGSGKPPPGKEEAGNCAFKSFAEESPGPLPEAPQGEAGPSFDALSLKRLLRELNPSFVFSEPFYQKAADFLALNRLDCGYASWLYEFCVKRKPSSIENYFYKVFFDARCAGLYLEKARPPPAKEMQCPVCSARHDPGLLACPACGLDTSHRRNQKEILSKKRFLEMPPAVKEAYSLELSGLLEKARFLGVHESGSLLKSLNQKYGVL